jgi:hypothetical protein
MAPKAPSSARPGGSLRDAGSADPNQVHHAGRPRRCSVLRHTGEGPGARRRNTSTDKRRGGSQPQRVLDHLHGPLPGRGHLPTRTVITVSEMVPSWSIGAVSRRAATLLMNCRRAPPRDLFVRRSSYATASETFRRSSSPARRRSPGAATLEYLAPSSRGPTGCACGGSSPTRCLATTLARSISGVVLRRLR